VIQGTITNVSKFNQSKKITFAANFLNFLKQYDRNYGQNIYVK